MDDQPSRQETLKAVLHYFYKDNTRSGSHSRYNLKYHIVWITKYRRSFMIGRFAARARQVLYEIAKQYGFLIIALEIMPDHIHLLVESPPRYSPTTIVQYLKGISSKMLRDEFLDVIGQFIQKEGTLWARGYYIATVADQVTTEVIREYIKNQNPNRADSKNTQGEKLVQSKLFA
jgi:putative transposase